MLSIGYIANPPLYMQSFQTTTDITMKSNWTNEGGIKQDGAKPSMSLLDRTALEQIVKVLDFGANKYDAHNWRKGIRYTRLIDAMLRHIHAYNDGENLDPESGLSHMAHVGCCVMFLLWMEQNRQDLDDRHHIKKALGQIEHEISELIHGPRSQDMSDYVEASHDKH